MKSSITALIFSLLLLSNCERNGSNAWTDLDYSKVRGYRENDISYKAPTVIGCVDDDLYNCNP